MRVNQTLQRELDDMSESFTAAVQDAAGGGLIEVSDVSALKPALKAETALIAILLANPLSRSQTLTIEALLIISLFMCLIR